MKTVKTVSLYLQQIKAHKTFIEFTDGESTVKIPVKQIIKKERMKGRDFNVTVSERWAKEEGL